jgi:hypothetical protein
LKTTVPFTLVHWYVPHINTLDGSLESAKIRATGRCIRSTILMKSRIHFLPDWRKREVDVLRANDVAWTEASISEERWEEIKRNPASKGFIYDHDMPYPPSNALASWAALSVHLCMHLYCLWSPSILVHRTLPLSASCESIIHFLIHLHQFSLVVLTRIA